MTFADVWSKGIKLASDNSPAILTAMGAVGAVTTGVLAWKAGMKTAFQVSSYNAEAEAHNAVGVTNNRDLVEYIHKSGLWREYIPAVATGVGSVVCIIAANRIESRRAAGWAAAYSLSERAIEQYKAKVIEKVGERKHQQIQDEVTQDRVLEDHRLGGVKIHGLKKGVLCYDELSGHYFWSTKQEIEDAINKLNHMLIHDGVATLADFYLNTPLPANSWTYNVGWNSDRLVEVAFSSGTTDDEDVPYLSVRFKWEPKADYGRFR